MVDFNISLGAAILGGKMGDCKPTAALGYVHRRTYLQHEVGDVRTDTANNIVN